MSVELPGCIREHINAFTGWAWLLPKLQRCLAVERLVLVDLTAERAMDEFLQILGIWVPVFEVLGVQPADIK